MECIFAAVRAEAERARSIYPAWPDNIVMAAAVAAEEMGEVVKDVNTYYWRQGDATIADIRKEAIQTMAMLVRFLEETPGMVDG